MYCARGHLVVVHVGAGGEEGDGDPEPRVHVVVAAAVIVVGSPSGRRRWSRNGSRASPPCSPGPRCRPARWRAAGCRLIWRSLPAALDVGRVAARIMSILSRARSSRAAQWGAGDQSEPSRPSPRRCARRRAPIAWGAPALAIASAISSTAHRALRRRRAWRSSPAGVGVACAGCRGSRGSGWSGPPWASRESADALGRMTVFQPAVPVVLPTTADDVASRVAEDARLARPGTRSCGPRRRSRREGPRWTDHPDPRDPRQPAQLTTPAGLDRQRRRRRRSGTVSVLEIARRWPRGRRTPSDRCSSSGTPAEELGLLGSDWFTRHPTVRATRSCSAQYRHDRPRRLGRHPGRRARVPPDHRQPAALHELGDIVDRVNRRGITASVSIHLRRRRRAPQILLPQRPLHVRAVGIPSPSSHRRPHGLHEVTDEPQYIDYPRWRGRGAHRGCGADGGGPGPRGGGGPAQAGSNGTCKQ